MLPPQARGAQALQLPIHVTEQYPKALGPTVSELKEVLPADQRYVDKTRFSMCGTLPSQRASARAFHGVGYALSNAEA